jgi:hypothetical protein
MKCVTREQLEAMAATYQEPEPEATRQSSNGDGHYTSRLLVEKWLAHNHVAYRIKKEKSKRGDTVYVLKECPFNGNHGDPDSCIMQAADGKLSFKCLHNSCQGRGWQEIKDKIGRPLAEHYDPPLRGRRPGPKARRTDQENERKQTVRILEPYRPFPVEALPGPVRTFTEEAAQALGCDPVFVALPALAVVASVIGNTRTIQLKRGWQEPSIVWTAVIAESGTLKSPAHAKVLNPLFVLQKKLLDEHQTKLAHYERELEAWKERKAARKKAGGLYEESPPIKPVKRRVVVSDTTVQKLGEILEDNPRGTLVARDELSGWIGSFTRFSPRQSASDLPNWLEMHRAGTVIIDRKTGDRTTLFIPHAAASVTGNIQPAVLARALRPDLLEAGFAARLLLAMPTKTPKVWTDLLIAAQRS